MAEQERDGIRLLAPLVHEVDLEGVLVAVDGDGRGELQQLVQLGLGLPPVVLVPPDPGEPLDVVERCAVPRAVGDGRLLRERRQRELRLQPLDRRIGDRDPVGTV